MGDLLASANQFQNFTCVSASGTAVFLSGQASVQMQIGNNGGLAISGISGSALFGSCAGPETARRLMTEDRTNSFEKDYNAIVKRSAEAAQTLNTALAGFPATAAPFSTFPNTGLGNQMRNVARMIAARQALGAKRQVFHVSIGGFDQHSGLINGHGGRMTELANAVSAFISPRRASIADSVTSFTASISAARSIRTARFRPWLGSASLRSAVKGGSCTASGPVPCCAAQRCRPGSLLPTTSVNHAATLATWFGIGPAQLADVLPNVVNYKPGLGFMPEAAKQGCNAGTRLRRRLYISRWASSTVKSEADRDRSRCRAASVSSATRHRSLPARLRSTNTAA
jgi:uncharacterized protein (DUF1501 family)